MRLPDEFCTGTLFDEAIVPSFVGRRRIRPGGTREMNMEGPDGHRLRRQQLDAAFERIKVRFDERNVSVRFLPSTQDAIGGASFPAAC